MNYQNWKGLNIVRAEEIENDIGEKIGKTPKKKDFINNGEYGAWMALYRHRRRERDYKNISPLPEIEKEYILFRKMISSAVNAKLIESIFKDFVHKIGPNRADDIVHEIKYGKR